MCQKKAKTSYIAKYSEDVGSCLLGTPEKKFFGHKACFTLSVGDGLRCILSL
jgi:hypothetical protein